MSIAFRGELVAQDPNDEPASVLLERIKLARKKNSGSRNDLKRLLSVMRRMIGTYNVQ
jgi:type I restriction enzyme S subunit